MTRSALEHVLFEAAALAANHNSPGHRAAAVRELSNIDVSALVLAGECRAHLALAAREAALGLAGLSSSAARAAAAEGLRSLVKAARAEPSPRLRSPSPVRHYWVDQ